MLPSKSTTKADELVQKLAVLNQGEQEINRRKMEAGNAEVEGLEEVAAQFQKRMLNYEKKDYRREGSVTIVEFQQAS